MTSWQQVYINRNEVRAKIVRDILNTNGINAVIVPKKDRSLNDFGNFEVVVNRDDVITAIKMIQDEIRFE